MSLSVSPAAQSAPDALAPVPKGQASPDSAPAAKSTAYGSAPAAFVTLSATAKAYATKHGHDPDGIQDGK